MYSMPGLEMHCFSTMQLTIRVGSVLGVGCRSIVQPLCALHQPKIHTQHCIVVRLRCDVDWLHGKLIRRIHVAQCALPRISMLPACPPLLHCRSNPVQAGCAPYQAVTIPGCEHPMGRPCQEQCG